MLNLGIFVNVTGKRRVSNVKINATDLNINKKNKTTLRLYMANGGDGYSMFLNMMLLKNVYLQKVIY